MFNNPQSRSWKALSLILLLAAVAGFVLLNLMVFNIPFDIPPFLWRMAVVPTALSGAAGFLMLRETRRARQDNGNFHLVT